MNRKRGHGLIRDAKGTTALEFAIVFPLFLLFFFGVVEFGQGLRVYNEMASAASRASRIVMLDGDVADTTIETEIRNVLSEFASDKLQVDFSTSTVNGKDYREVKITYPYQFIMPLFDSFDVTISAASRTIAGS